LFGIGMMFLYYGYLVPLSRRIGRGFYAGRHLVGERLRPVLEDRRRVVAGRRGDCASSSSRG
jgi:hypothetical protein